MAEIRLSANKSVINGNEIATLTAEYVGQGAGKQIKLMLAGIAGMTDTVVGSGTTDAAGKVSITWKGATKGAFTFYAISSIIPGLSDCGLWCDRSNDVSVSVAEGAPCGPTDFGCRLGDWAGLDMKAIAGLIVLVVVLIVIFVYFPKKR